MIWLTGIGKCNGKSGKSKHLPGENESINPANKRPRNLVDQLLRRADFDAVIIFDLNGTQKAL